KRARAGSGPMRSTSRNALLLLGLSLGVDHEKAADFGRLIDRREADERAHALDDALYGGSGGVGRGGVAAGLLRALGLVDHDEDDVAGVVDREGADEGRKPRILPISAAARLVGGPGLAAHAIARRVRASAGARFNDQAHQPAHVVGGRGLDDLAAGDRFAFG